MNAHSTQDRPSDDIKARNGGMSGLPEPSETAQPVERARPDAAPTGEDMLALMSRLYPICRSITGDGFRQTLSILQDYLPLERHEVPSGTEVFDWVVPPEWNMVDAYVKDMRGERVIDFRRSSLHVLNYSVPIHATMSLAELRPHIATMPEHPDWIPYRTSYYREAWGFCMTQNALDALPEGMYEVHIDASLKPGSLTYGECCLPGESRDEVLISCHACHPSLCNDNLSGIAVATFLARGLAALPRRYSYRFLFIPATIGAITWLALNEAVTPRISHGLVLTCAGDAGKPTYKRSRRGTASIDRAMAISLRDTGRPFEIEEFSPYDERQYCSPGFNLPVGCFMRTPHGRFPEYHSSADNLDLMSATGLRDSLSICESALRVLEDDRTYVSLNPKCEPQLGRRGLYRLMGGHTDMVVDETALLWVLNQADGTHSLLDIAERSRVPFTGIKRAATVLLEHHLLAEAIGPASLFS
jgi:aminopeptidase-like protein